jgi:SAP domain-containing ribonucleoprotein
MESKLKGLKVVELRDIIAKANVPCPPKAVKADLIASIIASPSAIQLYYQLHPPPASVFFTPRLKYSSSSNSASNLAPASLPTRQVEQVPKKVVLSKAPSPVPAASTFDITKDPEAEKRTQRAARFGIPEVEKPVIIPPTSKPSTSAPDVGFMSHFSIPPFPTAF